MKPQFLNRVCPVCGVIFKMDRCRHVYCSRECYNKTQHYTYTPLDEQWIKPVHFYPELLVKANKAGFDNLVEFVREIYWQWGSASVVAKYLGMQQGGGSLSLIRKAGCQIRPRGGRN